MADDNDDENEAKLTRKAYVTPEGFTRMKEEYDQLLKVERPKVTRAVSAAAEMGDRSENAEYIYGKKRLREIDKRIHYLSKRLQNMEIVHPQVAQKGKAAFGAWVTVEDEDGEQFRYKLVGPDEVDVAQMRISIESPVGRALLGKKVDDDVTVNRPKGRAVFTVLKIEYEGI